MDTNDYGTKFQKHHAPEVSEPVWQCAIDILEDIKNSSSLPDVANIIQYTINRMSLKYEIHTSTDKKETEKLAKKLNDMFSNDNFCFKSSPGRFLSPYAVYIHILKPCVISAESIQNYSFFCQGYMFAQGDLK